MPRAPTTWVLTDGRAGNERQALALAHALSAIEPRIWRLQAQSPWQQAAPRKLPGSDRAFGAEFRAALHEPPTLAIGCGRQAALATRLLREAGARSVQILDPRIAPHHWDAVVVPEHDRVRGTNVVTALGSLHEVDATWLAKQRASHAQLSLLPAPHTAFLVGGPIANAPLDDAWWNRAATCLRDLHRHEGGSLSVCVSPRTPEWLIECARRDLVRLPGAHWLGPDMGPNPYPGLLAWADRIVVSPDSVNMLCEAIATTAQVQIASPEIARGRHARLIASLHDRRRAAALDASLAHGERTPIVELQRVAAQVHALIDN